MRPIAAHQLLKFCGAVVGKTVTQSGVRSVADIILVDSQFRPVRATTEAIKSIMLNLQKQN